MNNSSFFRLLDSKYASLTPKQAKVADYLRENYRRAVFMPLAQLSAEAGVSEASFIRFARSLGYDGFAELQGALQNHVSESMQDTVERFQTMSNNMEPGDVLRTHIDSNIRSLGLLEKYISLEEIRTLASRLRNYSRIYSVGFESTACFAEYTAYYLTRGSLPGEAVTEKTGNLFSRIQQAGPGTLVIAFIVSRYPAAAVSFCGEAAARGAEICVVSDVADNPLGSIAAFRFPVAARRTSGINMESQVNMLSIIQLIVLEALFSENSTTEKALKELEEYNRKFRVFCID